MFTPGRTPGQLDRRALGQRLLATLVPRLQSFRFQAGQQTPGLGQALAPSMPSRPGVGMTPNVGFGAGTNMQSLRPTSGVMAPPPAAAAPAGGGAKMQVAQKPMGKVAKPAGLSPALAAPAPTYDAKDPFWAMKGDPKGIEAFIKMLAALSAAGGDPGAGGIGNAASAGLGGLGSQAEGGRDTAFS